MAETSLENVADLIAKPPEVYVPQPRYVSKYREKIKTAAKRGKSAHKTLGVPSVNLNPPTEYLKKNSKRKNSTRPEFHHEHYRRPGYQHKLPDWQPIKASDKEARISQSHSIDFTKRNVEEAKNSRPSKARKYYVDDRHGSAHPLRTSGLFPVYRNRKNFGEVPGGDSPAVNNRARLRERNAASPEQRDKTRGKTREEHLGNRREDKSKIERHEKEGRSIGGKATNERSGNVSQLAEDKSSETSKARTKDTKFEVRSTKSARSSQKKGPYSDKADEESIVSSRPQQPRCRYVTEDERAELLYGMKKKWDEMMKQFQCLPFLTDTPPKAKRKSQMEKDLHQLEKDIEVIERHPYIYVYSDEES